MTYGQVVIAQGPVDKGCGVQQWLVTCKANSKRPAEWYITKTPSNVGAQPKSKIPVHTGGTGTSLKEWITLDPSIHAPGDYWVVARVYGQVNKWRWSDEKISFHPNVEAVLHTALDDNAEFDVGTVSCEARLMLRPLEQSCMNVYRVRIRRTHLGSELGPEMWLTGWTDGPVPDLDLRYLAARAGYDLVPGQCYKVDVFSKFLLNGGPWRSAGKKFCIDCCCG